MQIELPKPHAITEPATYFSPGVTSPYADPPLERVFIIGFFGGGRITLTQAEAKKLYAELGKWIESAVNTLPG